MYTGTAGWMYVGVLVVKYGTAGVDARVLVVKCGTAAVDARVLV